MVTIKTKGNFKKTEKFLSFISKRAYLRILDKYGRRGVAALSMATPHRTGLTASCWTYEITDDNGKAVIAWKNSNIQNGINIALIIQYGHGTGTGGYVQGIDYVNPAMKSIFDDMANEAWKEVTKA